MHQRLNQERVVITRMANNGALLPGSFTLAVSLLCVSLKVLFLPAYLHHSAVSQWKPPGTQAALFFFNTGAFVPLAWPPMYPKYAHTLTLSALRHMLRVTHSAALILTMAHSVLSICLSLSHSLYLSLSLPLSVLAGWPCMCADPSSGRKTGTTPTSSRRGSEINRRNGCYVSGQCLDRCSLTHHDARRSSGSRPKFSRNERSCHFRYRLRRAPE